LVVVLGSLSAAPTRRFLLSSQPSERSPHKKSSYAQRLNSKQTDLKRIIHQHKK
jgi:hypothetical protein